MAAIYENCKNCNWFTTGACSQSNESEEECQATDDFISIAEYKTRLEASKNLRYNHETHEQYEITEEN